MPGLLDVSEENVQDYWRLFVNRRAYILQSLHPDEDGNYRYFRPKGLNGEELGLTDDVICQHLQGKLTLSLYTPNPETQRSKWFVLDGDYKHALEHLCTLQYDMQYVYNIDAALEQSRRGAHLWIFCEEPLRAREGRQLLLRLATKLQMPVKGPGQIDGLEIFPKHDELPAGEYGNAIRGPLGIHRKVQTRYWFYGAERDLTSQLAYLKQVRKLTQDTLASVVAGLAPLPEFGRPAVSGMGQPSASRIISLVHPAQHLYFRGSSILIERLFPLVSLPTVAHDGHCVVQAGLDRRSAQRGNRRLRDPYFKPKRAESTRATPHSAQGILLIRPTSLAS